MACRRGLFYMELIAKYLLAGYAIFYVALMFVWFFNKKPLLRYLRYSTLILIVLIVFLILSLWIEGKLFHNIIIHSYF